MTIDDPSGVNPRCAHGAEAPRPGDGGHRIAAERQHVSALTVTDEDAVGDRIDLHAHQAFGNREDRRRCAAGRAIRFTSRALNPLRGVPSRRVTTK